MKQKDYKAEESGEEKLCKDCQKLDCVGLVTLKKGYCRNCGVKLK